MTECFLKKYSPKRKEDFFIDNYETFETPLKYNSLINGDSGTGKTSLIIHLIHMYLKYQSNVYFDENVLFMNNLKDQGIQFCRSNVKLFCQTPSDNSETKKIIAIDDIDEFSEICQQVICNYVDKYSKNIIFLATCTNSLKVYDGLKSRMMIINIKHPTNEKLNELCDHVLKNETISIDEKNKKLIIESSNFSYKVLLNTLFKVKIFDDTLDDDATSELITSINFNEFDNYILNIKTNNINNALEIIFKIADSGISVIDILYEFTLYIKRENKILNDTDKYEIITLVSKYITIFHDVHEDVLEIAFLTNDLISYIGAKTNHK